MPIYKTSSSEIYKSKTECGDPMKIYVMLTELSNNRTGVGVKIYALSSSSNYQWDIVKTYKGKRLYLTSFHLQLGTLDAIIDMINVIDKKYSYRK